MKTETLFRTYTAAAAVTVLTLVLWGAGHASASVTYDTRALTGDQAPGTDPGVVYSVFGTPVINGSGQTAFGSSLIGAGVDATNSSGLWAGGTGSLSLVARSGDAAPGTDPGVVFDGPFGFNSPVINDAGQTAFKGFLTGTGVDGSNSRGLWSEGSGSLSLIARTGDAAADPGGGAVYADLAGTTTVLNDAGQVAYEGRIIGTGIVIGTNDRGIWSEGSGSLSVTARTADAAAGTGPGVVYNQFLFSPVINGSGQTAFFGGLAGTGVDATNSSGIWAGGTGSLSLVARSGDAAPGTDPGVVFDGPFGFNSPVINDAGQTAFKGFLTGTGVDTTNDTGIWSEGSGSLSLLAREGFDAPGTAPGVLFNSIGNPVLNGAGQTAFGSSLIGAGVDATNNRGLWLESSGLLGLVARSGDAAPGTEPGVVFRSSFNYALNGAGQIAFTNDVIDPVFFSRTGIWATDLGGAVTLIALEGDLFDVNDDPLIDDFRTINLVRFWTFSGGEDGRSSAFNDAGQLVFRLRFTDNSEGIFVATLTAALAGDLNGDGFVGIADLNIVLGNWNQNVTPGDPLAGDPTGDGFVGIADLNVVLGNWNAGTPPGASGAGSQIPEPGTAVSVLLLGGLALRRRPG